MAKEVIFGEEARRRMKVGIDKLADAVRITLGPRGRNVILDKKFGSPDIVDDGVTDRAGAGVRGPVREHGRATREGSRIQDERQRRRRHDDGDRARARA